MKRYARPIHRRDEPAVWGVISTFGAVHSEWSAGSGSGTVTSSAARNRPGLPGMLELLLYGGVSSAIYAQLAVGFTLIFGVARIFNLGHGSFYALGAYFTYAGHAHLKLPLLAAAAARQQAGYKGFLVELLSVECDEREERRKTRLVREASFPRTKRLDSFDFNANPLVDAALIHTLAKGAWIKAGQPLCLIGDSGTGKSHLLIGLGIAAAEAGYRVRYTTAAALVNELVEAADDKSLSRTIARYGRVDLLCIDELGYMELDRRGAELLFQVLTEREEKNSVAIASNQSFSGWTDTFTDPRLCAAIIDRLTFNGTIIETGTTSYRLAHTRATASPSTDR